MPETDGTGCFGLERDLLCPFRVWTHWESPQEDTQERHEFESNGLELPRPACGERSKFAATNSGEGDSRAAE